MALDPVINFGKVTVSTTYDNVATSIVLSAGHGAKLPSTFSYNLTWWNSTDYPDPSDDPNVEIVRCTARSTDTLTVSRGQESISATTKNTAGKTYKMVLSFTKKMKDDIETAYTPGGSNTQIQYNDSGVFGGVSALTFNKNTSQLTLTQILQTTGSPTHFLLTGAAHTTLTASTEAVDINFNLARTVQFATGAITTQRAFLVQAPTYAFVGASTITNAGTLVVTGAPVAGTNAIIINPYSLWVQSGISHFGAQTGGSPLSGTGALGVEFADSTNSDGGYILNVTNTNSGTNAYTGVNLNNDLANGSTYTHFAGTYYSSSGYTNTSFGTLFAIPNQLALQNTDGIVTISAQKDTSQYINFVIGGGTTPSTINEVGRFSLGGLTVGLAGTTLGTVKFSGSSSGTTTIQPATSASGVLTLPSATDTLVAKATTDTLTNKRITARVGTEASSTTSTPTADSVDQWNVTALAVADAFAAPTGTPTNAQKLIIRIKDNGTARALTWNAIYRVMGTVLPSTTVISKTLYLGFIYNAADSKWDLVASAQEA